MKAVWNNKTVAEAPKERLIYIEGNWYFPPDSIQKEYLNDSNSQTSCPWKGEARYYNLMVDGQKNGDAAWYYATPKQSAIETVKNDFTNYVAFWRGVEVKE